MRVVAGEGGRVIILYNKKLWVCALELLINKQMYSLPTDLYGEVEISDDGKIKVSQGVQVPSEDDDVLIKSTREEVH